MRVDEEEGTVSGLTGRRGGRVGDYYFVSAHTEEFGPYSEVERAESFAKAGSRSGDAHEVWHCPDKGRCKRIRRYEEGKEKGVFARARLGGARQVQLGVGSAFVIGVVSSVAGGLIVYLLVKDRRVT